MLSRHTNLLRAVTLLLLTTEFFHPSIDTAYSSIEEEGHSYLRQRALGQASDAFLEAAEELPLLDYKRIIGYHGW